MTDYDESKLFSPPIGTLRIISFYVGQGDSTFLMIPDGNNHIPVLIDINQDSERGGVDVAEVLKGKIPKGEIIFINTHPHDDHLKGIEDLHENLQVREVWHSGHKPSQKYGDTHKKLENVVNKVGKTNEFYLRGSNEQNTLHTDREETSKTKITLGEADFQVFSPAKYVCDEIADETPEQRRNRIHEQCGVIQISYEGRKILISGDADKAAWERITPYFGDTLKSDVWLAPHHGARTTFKNGEDDENQFIEQIEKISPEYLIISAPTTQESPHKHPNEDALAIYQKHISRENIFHLGEKKESLVLDIEPGGNISIDSVPISNNKKRDVKPSDVLYSAPAKSRPYCTYSE